MKKLSLLFTLIVLIAAKGYSQVANYAFSQASGVYTAISGGTNLGTATNDDTSFPNLPIGFTFNYNGVNYTTFSVNSNGFITMGNNSSYSYLILNSQANVVAALNADLQGNSTGGNLQYLTTGSAPNRVLVVQWTNYMHYPSGNTENYNFQIRLYETTNVVEVDYGTFSPLTTTRTYQVGLTGSTTADFNDRTTTANWSATTAGANNSVTCTVSPTVFPASGLSFMWTPLSLDMGAIAIASPSANSCYIGNQTVTVTIKNFTSSTINYAVNPVTVNCSVTGPNPFTFPGVVLNSGTLAAGGTQNVVISTTYNMTLSGTYGFSASTTLAGDGNAGNNSVGPVNIVNAPLSALAGSSPTSICTGNTSQLNSAITGISTTSYTMSSIPYAPLTGNSAVLSGFTSNDDGYKTITLPAGFTFSFFGNTYGSINVETNGYIDFGAPTSVFTAQLLPNASTPNNLIALCWNDLNVVGGGSIDTFTVGTAPFRKFVVRYNTVPFYSNTPPGVTGQIILYETTNVIDVLLTQVQGSSNLKTTGIENSTGTIAYTPAGRNDVNFSISTPEAWRFAPTTPAFTYLWTPNGPGSGINTGNEVLQSTSANPTSTTTYTVTITSPSGCTATATTTVTVNPLPNVTATGTATICTGNSTPLTANGANTYSWAPATGLSSTTVSNPTASPTTTTTYTVTGTSAAGCTATAMVTITVNPLPTITVSGTMTICNGNSTTLTANGASTYSWSSGGTTSAETVSPASTTTYTVTGTDANSCSNTATATVTVNPLPTVNLGPDVTVCGSTVLDAQNAGSTFAWSNSATTQTITVTSTGNYSVVVTNGNGCSNSDAINVTVNTPPTVALGPDVTQCGGTVMLDAQNTGSTYAWSESSTTQTITVSSSGNYSVVVTDANGCTGTDAVNVTINTPPTVALGPDVTQCGGTVMLDAQNAGSTYAWSESSTTQTITVSTSGNYSVVVTDANGCTGTDAINVTINTPPTVALGPDVTACGSTVLDAGNPGLTYAWSESSTTQTITVSSTGTYSVVVTDANGCTGSDAIDVTINPLPTVNLGPDVTQCGGSVMLDAQNAGSSYMWSTTETTQTITVSTGGTYSVTVTDGNGCSNTDAVDVIINTPPTVNLGADISQCGGNVTLDAQNAGATYSWSDGSNTQTITVGSGNYFVIVTDANGCTGSDTINVTINPGVTPPSLGNDTTICSPDSVLLDAGTGYSSYAWSNGSTAQSIYAATTNAYTVTVSNPFGCTASATINVTVNVCTGTGVTMNEDALNVYPNPSEGMVYVSTGSDLGQLYIEILDVNGKLVYSSMNKEVKKGFSKGLDLSSLADGVYSIRLNTGTSIQVKKLVIRK